MSWRSRLIRWLGGVEPVKRRSYVAEVKWSRCEELRADRLGLTEDIIRSDRRAMKGGENG